MKILESDIFKDFFRYKNIFSVQKSKTTSVIKIKLVTWLKLRIKLFYSSYLFL